MAIDVPAYVQNGDFKHNNIEVRGGKNWDLSRSAAETPIAKDKANRGSINGSEGAELNAAGVSSAAKGTKPCFCNEEDPTYQGSPYIVKDHVPQGSPTLSITYKEKNTHLSSSSVKALQKLPVGASVVVIGNAGLKEDRPHELAEQRIRNLKQSFNGLHIKIINAISYGNSRPLSSDSYSDEANRRVDIWVVPK